ncbi:DUF445 family protein [Clostridium sp. FP2]|uniref:DUF445 family protein n=1 Tax=Clostridium TaxID=1485 RepID=UPI0013E908DF|nr:MULTISPECIES: DUF445 family protein [Clostridium]MBW9158361.1 DUF445 family protein [Clostridium tagluense]MBZ9621516.1 DUF445 family protein [Clostridium sp. FP2]WLC65874.1 DUF445 family protein [Clostridium tagluense]
MKFLIGSLVGAIIGYITNWLAIKMLFRPHKELKIGKFKVPFTPGLIPKEKSRIAKSVGESIGQHLLTKETILKSLCSENMNEQLDFWVQSKIGAIENSDVTVENEIKGLLGDEFSNFIQNTNRNVSKLFVDYINEEDVKQAIGKYVKGQIILELAAKPEVICQSELYNSIKNKVLNAAIEYKDTEKFYGEIQNILEEKVNGLKVLDKSFEEVIPKGITDNIKVYVYGKRYDIAMAIKKIIKEEKTKKKLRQIVGETIATKLNPMIAMFMNADSTYEKVVTGINEFLDEDENHNDIALMINDIIDKFLKSSVSSVFSEFSKEGIHDGIEPLIHLFTTEIVDEKLIRNTLDKLEDKFNNYISIEAMLEKTGIDYKSEIEKIIKSRIEAMTESNSVKIKIAEIVSVMINRLLNVEMKSIFEGEGDKLSKSISIVVKELYNKFIENKAADVVEVLDIAKIVEDKINEFDVDFSEKIILDIASKELNAITWLGALLGAVMGLLSPILGSL